MDRTLEVVKNHMVDLWAMNPAKFNPTAPFSTMGGDDLDVISLAVQVEISLGIVSYEEINLTAANTPEDLVVFINSLREIA